VERLAILHDFGAHYGGQVLQIVNRTDLALDFGPDPRLPGTAFRPFAGLYKSQIRLLGQELGIPSQILERRPSLDSYPGQSTRANWAPRTSRSTPRSTGCSIARPIPPRRSSAASRRK
jgi:hypothetical protein